MHKDTVTIHYDTYKTDDTIPMDDILPIRIGSDDQKINLSSDEDDDDETHLDQSRY